MQRLLVYSFHVPPRGNLWPKRDTNAKFYRVRDDAGKISYRVSFMPVGHDSYWLRKFLIEQGTESLLSKAGAFFFTGLLGPILAESPHSLVPERRTRFSPGNMLLTTGTVGPRFP